jgi:phosphoglycolate phosphatase
VGNADVVRDVQRAIVVLLAFDFDGTIMDTLRDLAEAASDLAEAYGGARLTEAQAAAMIGDGAPLFVRRILAHVGLHEVPDGAVARYLDFYERRVFDHTTPYPGVTELLRRLSGTHRLALLTNKPETSARALLQHTGLDTWFDDCVFGDGALPRKPDPAGLRWLMARAGTGHADTVMVGDSIMDLEAGRAAGVRVCLAKYGFGFERIPASAIRPEDGVIDTPLDLAGWIDSLAAAAAGA